MPKSKKYRGGSWLDSLTNTFNSVTNKAKQSMNNLSSNNYQNPMNNMGSTGMSNMGSTGMSNMGLTGMSNMGSTGMSNMGSYQPKNMNSLMSNNRPMGLGGRKKRRTKRGGGPAPVHNLDVAKPTYWIKGGKKSRKGKSRKSKRRTRGRK